VQQVAAKPLASAVKLQLRAQKLARMDGFRGRYSCACSAAVDSLRIAEAFLSYRRLLSYYLFLCIDLSMSLLSTVL
jgi:hypothetical protein